MNNLSRLIESCIVCTPFETIPYASVGISDSGLINAINRVYSGSKDDDKSGVLNSNMLIPGLVDIHVHGGFGVTFGEGELSSDLEKYSRFASSHGVTGFLMSIAGPNATAITQTIKAYAEILGQKRDWPGAIPLGMHLEGPFLNPEKHGAFNPSWIHNPELDEVKAYLKAGEGWIKQISMAPELPGSEKIARYLSDAGVVAALGHSNTNFETARAALNGSYTHVTHTFNAQSPLNHREPGVVGAILSSEKVTAELIGDTIHVHPAVMKILYRCLGPERLVLITDAMPGAGLPDGEYELLSQKVTVKDGKATLPDGTIGGSTGTLDGCLRNMVQLANVPLADAVRMASLNPAKVIGVEKHIGSIEIGKDANLVALDQSFNVSLTMVKGKIVYPNGK